MHKEHNSYEAALILNPNLSEKDVQKIAQETKDMLVKFGAAAVSDERVERRALAYPVKKQNEGFYVYIYFTGPSTVPGQVRYELRHREGLMRMAFVRSPIPAPEPPPAPVPPAPPEAPAAVEVSPAPEAKPAPTTEPVETGPEANDG